MIYFIHIPSLLTVSQMSQLLAQFTHAKQKDALC